MSLEQSTLRTEAEVLLTSSWFAAVGESRLTSFAKAYPQFAARFAQVASMTLEWFQSHLPRHVSAAHSLRADLSDDERAAVAVYSTVSSGITLWGEHGPPPLVHLRDALDILLYRLWCTPGPAKLAVLGPREVIAFVKDPEATCVFCGQKLKNLHFDQALKTVWKSTEPMMGGECDHSFYDDDEAAWLTFHPRIVTFQQVRDFVACLARRELGIKGMIIGSTPFPDDDWGMALFLLDLADTLDVDIPDDTLEGLRQISELEATLADALGIDASIS